MAKYPTRVLAELAGGAHRERLRTVFEEVLLPDQPPEVQRAIGVAFGREAAGGFGNASVVGLKPAASAPDLDAYPIDYRLGLVEGMVINYEGQIGRLGPELQGPMTALRNALDPAARQQTT
jgi:hypothetical protein